MQRYFVEPGSMRGDTVVLRGSDAHHIAHVLRGRKGDRLIVSDGREREVLAEIADIAHGAVAVSVLEELEMNNEPAVDIWIAQSLPKADKMEAVIQKCTEIGAARLIPFVSARTVVQYDANKEQKRLERWRKIAKEAAEQAHRNRVPEVEAPVSWKRLLELVSRVEKAWICCERGAEDGLRSALRRHADLLRPQGGVRGPLMVMIGPEGGYTEEEMAEAERAGCGRVSLGPRILRTETAGMAALTCILYEYGQMGG
jgi:RNA methyltransferase, RsmE family